ncbi:hypothetical protein [Alkalitalea saponilacus]|uniref:Uncharacterized protein n=1 Tax=Alkalitalea saponilacus TaxID=889453 RepID=A0A1T5HUA3_9BACT|nr:hypothetical protein [Alkalitalea saponilacus]ASB50444.1 hypothetical protein CDL62_15450 [Alkalitalea saponilacus]SKC24237.1 hypothetical protein SAMN03080601_03533 [Alkalitalea saponilacus]
MKNIIYIGIFIVLITSCKQEIEESSVFKTGDSRGNQLFYNILEPLMSINTIIMGEMDTVLYDTIFLDVNEDQIIDFTFIIEQNFVLSVSKYPSQKITIKTGSDVLLQLMSGIQPTYSYVRTASKGEKVETGMPWIANQVFFLTHIRYNFVEVPRYEQPYLPFKFENGDIGWLRMGFETDSMSYLMQRFYIESYCLKKSH